MCQPHYNTLHNLYKICTILYKSTQLFCIPKLFKNASQLDTTLQHFVFTTFQKSTHLYNKQNKTTTLQLTNLVNYTRTIQNRAHYFTTPHTNFTNTSQTSTTFFFCTTLQVLYNTLRTLQYSTQLCKMCTQLYTNIQTFAQTTYTTLNIHILYNISKLYKKTLQTHTVLCKNVCLIIQNYTSQNSIQFYNKAINHIL